eukprot:CAMPEP_0181246320 /NCGR_PEP_ID=MMETSP1096-20121128/43940_1 /TAXON_ID=156174 ORGANISM="Chrysochromulina ericina, Strain CCMP281" /NCGR_SAMPLE_ID=MMETSP1096 /ASSEMBLY_ACC=CAM_ASM_000453 /LENGTH=276 /DNA_ID=CAMNT_0023343147 /DNA_START=183 /DNA_END=1013 /DNA_ORIENTATION=-
MDAGAGGMWYFYRRGSGVWLQTGRMKAAPGKNVMLASLLGELAARPRLYAQWRALSRQLGLFTDPDGDHKGRSDHQRLEATAEGRELCVEAGVAHCRDEFILDDSWDEPLIWAGRALDYDTLFLTATLLPSPMNDSEAITFVSAYPEIVDLRVPDLDWAAIPSTRTHPYLEDDLTDRIPVYARRKRPEAASRWLRSLQNEGVLSLRDPLDPLNSDRARPCNFSYGPTVVLRCPGHPPTRWRTLPVLGAWDSCSIAMCGHNDLSWLHDTVGMPSSDT